MPMNYRDAAKLIKKNGGKLSSHGSRHDIFIMPWGTKIAVPRHPGDFSKGVEDDIKKRVNGVRKD